MSTIREGAEPIGPLSTKDNNNTRTNTPGGLLYMSDTTDTGPVLAADGTPLKRSLARALRMQKMRALALIAPLLLFVLLTFILPIGDMLFRSVENSIVSETLPRATAAAQSYDADSGEAPPEYAFDALAYDLVVAAEKKIHTRVGSRLNYENAGISSLFRKAGRRVDDMGEVYLDQFVDLDPAWEDPQVLVALFADPSWAASAGGENEARFEYSSVAGEALPGATDAYAAWARTIQEEDQDSPTEEEPWAPVYMALYKDLAKNPDAASAFEGETAARLAAAAAAIQSPDWETMSTRDAFIKNR